MRRPLGICFGVLLLAQVISVWMVRYYPSQDGPSHLYNAAVLANYDRTPVFRDFYSIHISPAGNTLAQVLQAGLLKIAGEYAAEKLLVTLCVVLLPLALRALLRTTTTGTSPFVLCGLVLTPSSFLHMGFWNFCLSIPLLLFALAYFRRRRDRWTAASVCGFALLSLLVYLAHMLSWAVLAMVIVLHSAADTIHAWRAHELPAARRTVTAAAAALSLPALLAWAYLDAAGNSMGFGGTFRERIWPLYSASFLRGLSGADTGLSVTFALIVLALAACAIAHRWGDWRLRGSDIFLLFAAACASAAFWAPETAASGAYIRDRLALYAWIFLVVWLAACRWPAKLQLTIAAAFAGFVVAALAIHLPNEAGWDRQLTEYAAARQFILPGSTVLPIQMESRYPAADPMRHAVGLVAIEGIDLRNYEAVLPYFCVQFRRGREPLIRVADPGRKELVEPEFDIARYEEAVGRNVDYVLAWGGVDAPELQRYAGQLAGYDSIYVSKPYGRARLYQRRQLRGVR